MAILLLASLFTGCELLGGGEDDPISTDDIQSHQSSSVEQNSSSVTPSSSSAPDVNTPSSGEDHDRGPDFSEACEELAEIAEDTGSEADIDAFFILCNTAKQ